MDPLTILATAVLMMAPDPAKPMLCFRRERMLEITRDMRHETRVAVLPQAPDHVIELFSGLDGITWSIVRTDATGVSCVIATGLGLQIDPPGRPM